MPETEIRGSLRRTELTVLILCLVVLLIFAYSRKNRHDGQSYLYPAADRLHLYKTDETAELSRKLPSIKSLAENGITLVPNLAPAYLPEDMGDVNSDERKSIFVRSLLPHLVFQNSVIAAERAALMELRANLKAGDSISDELSERVKGLFRKYKLSSRVASNISDPKALDALLDRVDQIPVSMALAQAANESGWGASRFATEGNNIFGQWKFKGPEGMVPEERPEGATYSLAVFPNLSVAVERYFLNLNTHRAYRKFRQLRAGMRRRQIEPDPCALATTLKNYSERGEDYVLDLMAIIRQNNLLLLDKAALVDSSHTKGVFATLYLPLKPEGVTAESLSGGPGKV